MCSTDQLDVNITKIEGADPTDTIRDSVVDDSTRIDGSSVNAIEAKVDTAQSDLDKLTGSDGATLATAQGNYAPNKVVPDAAGTAPTVAEIQAEMEEDGASLCVRRGGHRFGRTAD